MINKALLAMLMLGSANAGIAQTTANRPPVAGASPRSSVAPTRSFTVRAGVDASYDSNVFGVSGRSRNIGSIAGRQGDDISVTPSIQFDILQPFGRQAVFLRGAVGYDFYVNNTQLNRERINLEAGGNVAIGRRCSGVVSSSYGRFRSNAGDVFAVSPVPIALRTNTEQRTSVGGQVQCGGIIGFSPSFGYRHSETRNSSELFEFNDSDQDSFDGSIGYERPTLGRLSIYGTYATGTYLRRNVLGLPNIFPGVPRDGVTSYSAGGRFEREIGSRASGSISIGYSWVDPKALFAQRFRGSNYAVNLSLRPSDKLFVDVAASRSADLSNSAFASYAVTDVYSLNGTYRLNPRTALNFGASHQIRDFRGSARSIDLIQTLDKDKFTRVYGGFAYDLNRRLRLNGLISQQRRQSDNAFFNYRNTTVSLGASLLLGR